ncbi:hypothetical protein RhiirA5_507054 [Rhizophagus irregularis]|uniref:Uncharacterized protein n=1 Tax=Rhizophagus irregularis TaxID=588596 RepID=A0A2N0R0N9_9GLOM|nr:hypothetical protein RhiirA5_507054 [Rhizophagus irregularis]PKC56865.1 hypothetical protein RhiirA1_541894 [Rhizophagus irregularis]GET61755.1 hypothetical protein RIR_e64775_A0A2N0R0N9_9GLOM [Rhizophagus irregularis DAOM 181602=DAOM 197198]
MKFRIENVNIAIMGNCRLVKLLLCKFIAMSYTLLTYTLQNVGKKVKKGFFQFHIES